MRRLFVLVAVAGLLAGAVAYPGWVGGRGLLRIQDARSTGNWHGSLMLAGINGSYSYEQVYRPGEIGMLPGTRLNTYDVTGAASVSPAKWFELFCWGGGAFETWRWIGADSLFSGYHNLVPGAKFSLPIIPVVKLGAVGTYSMYPNFGDTRGGWTVDSAGAGRFAFPFVNGPSWTALVTIDLPEKVKWTPVLHFNYGQAYDKDENDVATDYTTLGGAVEYEIGKLDLFAEFVSIQTGGAAPFDKSGRAYVTPGFKFGYLAPLVLEGGVSIGMTDNVPDLELAAGLGLAGRIFTPKKPTTGVVAGKVIDAGTGDALAASVGFPGEKKPGPYATDEQGTFKVKGIRAGTVKVKASAPGYVPAEQELDVVAGKTASVEIALEREVTTGSIAGRVTDPATGAPLAALVSLDDADARPTDADGRYRFEVVAAGGHEVTASADGYMTATSKVQVAARQEAALDFQLVKAGVKITLKVYFDFDKAEIKPESHKALADAAKILTDNPGIKVEIHGHTDDVGSADYNQRLSLRRAQAVVDYLVTRHGVARGRLTSRGFGLAKPVASSDTEEGRAQNRRVEFFVVE